MKSLKIKEIRTDAGTQIRVRLNDDTVKEYAEAYKDGAKFPPVIVFHDGSEYILADGFHRVFGAMAADFKDVLADIRKGSRVDALKYALGANSNHGLKRSPADKRNAIHVALKEFAKLSNAEIARLCAVDDHTVSDVRKSMESTSEIPRLDTRIGSDGRERKLPVPTKKPLPSPPTKPVEKTISIPVPQKPKAPEKPKEPEAILDKTGHPIPKNLLELWERGSEVQEGLTLISAWKSKLKRAQDDKDKLYALVNYSSAISHLEQAWTDIKTALPFAVCPTCQGKTSNCTLCKGRGLISEFHWRTVVPEETKQIRKKAQTK